MIRGGDLVREEGAEWGMRGTEMLLNPRWPRAWRERVLRAEFPDLADHVWVATSGTGGVIKLAALSRAALACSAETVNAHLEATDGDIWLNPLPLFHVGGLGTLVRAAVSGARWHQFHSWDAHGFAQEAVQTEATLTSLVPAQVSDLVRVGVAAPPSLRAAVVGGGALGEKLHEQALRLGWPLVPSYGLTEASSQVATAGLADGGRRGWLFILPHIETRVDEAGILAIRGASLLTGWMVFDADAPPRWEDPKIDGWLRTQDRVELQEDSLRVLGRADDLVKIRGEFVDCSALEMALQDRVTSGAVVLHREPDERTGHRLRVIAEHAGAAAEAAEAMDVFPPFARPASIDIAPITRTALGKVVR